MDFQHRAAHLNQEAIRLPGRGTESQKLSCRYTNGAFYIDMPRGCITVMEKGGYAATGMKHCVRPVDMTGVLLSLKNTRRSI